MHSTHVSLPLCMLPTLYQHSMINSHDAFFDRIPVTILSITMNESFRTAWTNWWIPPSVRPFSRAWPPLYEFKRQPFVVCRYICSWAVAFANSRLARDNFQLRACSRPTWTDFWGRYIQTGNSRSSRFRDIGILDEKLHYSHTGTAVC